MKVLVACEFSGVVRRAFAQLGHEVYSCDLEPSEDNSPKHLRCDVRNILDEGWDLMIAHPPCTYLSVTGNKWFNEEYRERFPNREQHRKDAVDFFLALTNAPIPRICIENPVGIMSRIYRRPDQIIQPYWFGHTEPKKTCLWLKRLPSLEPTHMVEPDYHTTKSGKRVPRWFFEPSPSEERKKTRNRTFAGIADAMALQWTEHEIVERMVNELATIEDKAHAN